MDYLWIAWIIVAVVCFVLEAATVSLISIWLGLSAVCTAIFSGFTDNLIFQIVFFTVLTAVLMIFTRPILLKYMKPKSTNALSLIGMTAIVTEAIDNIEGKGQVKVNGNTWTARTEDGNTVDAGIQVTIVEIRGVTLYVKIK